jgi:hypothetical protein
VGTRRRPCCVSSDFPIDCSSAEELGADGLDREAEPLGSARQATLGSDHAEEVQVTEIDAGSFHGSLFTK